MLQKKKIAVAMSGGIDSSVAAAILKDKGYQVFGVTMTLFPQENENTEDINRMCSSSRAANDARKICEQLGITHHVLNLKDAFKEKVVDYFIREYERGRTPNPCVACNRFIKFDVLLKEVFSLGGEQLATGHYARLFYNSSRDIYYLHKARDSHKDQTYFLYNLSQKELKYCIFPLGDYEKEEIREMAGKAALNIAKNAESQEICFIEDNDYKNFLRNQKNIDFKPGPFLNTAGKKMGTHQGLPFYTVGQRKGLGLAVGYPLYVVDIDFTRNAIILGRKEELFSQGLIAEKVNYIAGSSQKEQDIAVKIRYRSPEVEARLESFSGNKVKVIFEKPQRAITPGQAVVFYQGNIVLGGGTIKERIR